MNERIIKILEKRGIVGAPALEAFLSPALDRLTNPFAIPRMEEACRRVGAAIARREKIFVYGDGDADGICAVFLLLKAFQATGADVAWYLTHRLEDYEIAGRFVDSLKNDGCSLLITADCGISSHQALTRADELDLDVVVLDHHLPDDAPLPERHIYVDPALTGAPHPAMPLSGAGLAFLFIQGLAAQIPGLRESKVTGLAEIAGLGTAGDSAPLTGDNRILLKEGLSRLPATDVPGLRRFLEYLGLHGRCSYRHLQMKVNPKLNTPGRFGQPETALRLLLSEEEKEIDALIREIVNLDRRRYLMTSQLLREIEERSDNGNGLVMAGQFPASLCGIVASRLADKRRGPVLVCSEIGGAYQCSGRSPSWFALHDRMEELRPLLTSFGGHARAVGLTFTADKLEEVRRGWQEIVAGLSAQTPVRTWDDDLDIVDLEPAFIRELSLLEPFGPGNLRPVFRCAGVIVQSIIRRERDRVKFWVRKGEAFYECESSGEPEPERLVPGREAAIHYTPHIRDNGGLYRVWLDVKYVE